jgi:sulfotransferase family protein
MSNQIILIILTILFANGIHASNKIVYLISPPRSLSVAFLRMMEARGDFEVFQEPSQKAYCIIHYPDLLKKWFLVDVPSTFNEVKNKIFQAAEYRNVFVKEMSFGVRDFLIGDSEIITSPHVRFIFLLRNPHHTVISFYKKNGKIPQNFSFLCGYQATYDILQAVLAHAVYKPLIIYSEDLYERPQEIAQQICNYLEIPFIQESLSWQDLGADFSGHEEWHEAKYKENMQHWHGEAIRSSGWGKPSTYEVDDSNQPTFSEVTNPEHRNACKKAYEENKIFYDLIKSEPRLLIYVN